MYDLLHHLNPRQAMIILFTVPLRYGLRMRVITELTNTKIMLFLDDTSLFSNISSDNCNTSKIYTNSTVEVTTLVTNSTVEVTTLVTNSTVEVTTLTKKQIELFVYSLNDASVRTVNNFSITDHWMTSVRMSRCPNNIVVLNYGINWPPAITKPPW